MSLFQHLPHPHIAERARTGPVRVQDQFPGGTGWIGRFNLAVARRGTIAFGTMWCAYAFAVYGTLGAVFPAEQNTLLYWSNWIQLVALPLLMVGAVVLGKASDARAAQTFADAEAMLHEALQIQAHLSSQDTAIAAIAAAVNAPPVADGSPSTAPPPAL